LVEVRAQGEHGVEELAEAARTSDLGHTATLEAPAAPLALGEDGAVTVRVFLLDDHEVVRRGLRELFEAEDDLEVVG